MADRKKTPDLLGFGLGDAPAADDELPIPIAATPAPTQAQDPAPVPANGTASKARSTKKAKTKSSKKAATPASAPPASPTPASPPTWEYLTVTFRDYGGWRPRLIDGAEVSGWKRQPLIHDYLAQLGAQGWEMVSMGERHRNQKEAYFKRPASTPSAGV